jgi:hypothetical protein
LLLAGDTPDDYVASTIERDLMIGLDCRRAFKTTQLCALNFTQGV